MLVFTGEEVPFWIQLLVQVPYTSPYSYELMNSDIIKHETYSITLIYSFGFPYLERRISCETAPDHTLWTHPSDFTDRFGRNLSLFSLPSPPLSAYIYICTCLHAQAFILECVPMHVYFRAVWHKLPLTKSVNVTLICRWGTSPVEQKEVLWLTSRR